MRQIQDAMRHFYILLTCIVCSFPAFANHRRYETSLEGYLGKVSKDSTFTVADSITGTAQRHAYLVLRLNELYGAKDSVALPAIFSADISFSIDYTASDNSTSTITDHLLLTYDSKKAGVVQVLKDLGNYKSFTLKISTVTINVEGGGTAEQGAALKYLALDGYIDVERQYELSCSSYLIEDLVVRNGQGAAAMEDGELPVSWNAVVPTGGSLNDADEYDLEWAWVDQKALDAGNYNNGGTSPDLQLVFKNNASRVTILGTSYTIPMLYDDNGVLFYRVRPVQYDIITGQRKEGLWSRPNTDDNGPCQFSFSGHERSLNWQASTSFAEEGKRKSVVQYFDGLQKSRQTVTKDNSSGFTVVAETLYDRQGRPAVQVLPAPTINSVIAYTPQLTVGVNGLEYDQDAYDRQMTPAEYCNAAAPPMGTQKGAAAYYSNTDLTNIKRGNPQEKFVPDAAGYPFTETRYTADNTGRIAGQSGVGPVHRLDGDHATRYFYGNPSQEELDGLFGTDAGYAGFYQKTMVKDANGQASISITDMQGKTVATALAGPAPSGMQTLGHYKSDLITEKLLSPVNNFIEGNSIVSSSSIMVTGATPLLHTFHYALTPESLNDAGCLHPSAPICYDCLYDLTITITTDCNNSGLPGDTAIVRQFTNLQLAGPDTTCTANDANFSVDFTYTLPPGVINITKRLSVSAASMDYYRAIYVANNTCRTKEEFIQDWRDSLSNRSNSCKPISCADCQAMMGTDSLDYEASYLVSYGELTSEELVKYKQAAGAAYVRLKKECTAICDGYNDIDNIRMLMLADMTPSGQFGRPSDEDDDITLLGTGTYQVPAFSIFKPVGGGVPLFRDPSILYKDADGNRVYPPQDEAIFTEQFEDSWAEALLPRHPEYNRWVVFQSFRPGELWKQDFSNTESYSEAVTKGYLNPAGNSLSGYTALPSGLVDPLFISQAAPYSSLIYSQLAAFRDSLSNFVVKDPEEEQRVLNIWQLVNLLIKTPPNHTLTITEFNDAIAPGKVFNSTYLCAADLQKAWEIFRALYLAKRTSLLNTILSGIPMMPSSAAAGYYSYFTTKSNVLEKLDLEGLSDAAITSQLTDATAAMSAQAQSTCESYASYWWNQLAPCNMSSTDSATLIGKLVSVCKNGYDQDHLMGASSVNPGHSYPAGTPLSFVQVMEEWLAAHPGQDPLVCNSYMLTAPKPYSRPSVTTNMPVVEKPSDCECERLNALASEAQVAGYGTSLSGYLLARYQTTIAQSDLNQLLAKCNSSDTTCRFLPAAILLPPVLQCLSAPVCRDCNDIRALKDSFLIRYPGTLQEGELIDTNQVKYQQLFANYMNFHTGFAYTDMAYLQFLDSCAANYSYRTPLHKYDTVTASDTARWVSNHGQHYLQVIPLSQAIQSGYFNSVTQGGNINGVEYYDTVCFRPFTLETRFKLPSQGATGSYLEFQLNYFMNGTFRRGSFAFDRIDGGHMNCYFNHDDSVGLIGPVSAPLTFDDWTVMKIEASLGRYKLYLNNQPILDVPHWAYDTFIGFFFTPYMSGLSVDWVKFYDEHGRQVMNEEFNNAGSLSEISLNPCGFNNAKQLCGISAPSPEPSTIPDQCADVEQLAVEKGTLAWQHYSDSIRNDFDRRYLQKCLAAGPLESFTVVHEVAEYHFTLYYYDRAGNLVQTVPPAGVQADFGSGWLGTVATARAAGNDQPREHTLATTYQYNSLNQVVEQSTPDAGTSKFWYDRLGRLVLSQNEKQWGMTPKAYSYTLYDVLGRIAEVGQKQNNTTVNQDLSRSNPNLAAFIAANNTSYPPTEVTRTVYDLKPSYNMTGAPTAFVQQSYTLRNRVSYTQYFAAYHYASGATAPDWTAYQSATYYNYDIHGNVSRLLQDYHGTQLGSITFNSNTFKLIAYDYDLISGKVNSVSYQPGFADQYYHEYAYDAENRLTDVYTTTNPLFLGNKYLEDHEANYRYYRHGPLARVLLGTEQVQGIDYAYTLQGWLKGVNATSLSPGNDIGADGNGLSQVGRDAIAFSLDYWGTGVQGSGDYFPIGGTTVQPFADGSAGSGSSFHRLYNGNIATMGVSLNTPTDPLSNADCFKPQLYLYQYDQLNRLVNMNVRRSLQSNSWYSAAATTDYQEQASYDPNGNILTYQRNGTVLPYGDIEWRTHALTMDQLTYKYPEVSSGGLKSNRLRYVHDQVNDDNYDEDLNSQTTAALTAVNNDHNDTQSSDNFQYDAIGNLIKDVKEGIDNIEWTVYGKIKTITKQDGSTIEYQYGPDGNRISKTVTPASGAADAVTTSYVRDAQGNTLAIYRGSNEQLYLQEQHIYGSSRLGLYRPGVELSSLNTNVQPRLRGNTEYELSNHLGNVLATISDRKKPVLNGSVINYFEPDVKTLADYYPFGMLMPGRQYNQPVNDIRTFGSTQVNGHTLPTDLVLYDRHGSASTTKYVAARSITLLEGFDSENDELEGSIGEGDYDGSGNQSITVNSADEGYRYGFNGKENDNEIKGTGNQLDFGARIYDPRIGRWLSVDPQWESFRGESPYNFSKNSPIYLGDPDGNSPVPLSIFLREVVLNSNKLSTSTLFRSVGEIHGVSMWDFTRLGRVFEDAALRSLKLPKNTEKIYPYALRPDRYFKPDAMDAQEFTRKEASGLMETYRFNNSVIEEVKFTTTGKVPLEPGYNPEQIRGFIDYLGSQRGVEINGRKYDDKVADYGVATLIITTPADVELGDDLIKYAKDNNVNLYQRIVIQKTDINGQNENKVNKLKVSELILKNKAQSKVAWFDPDSYDDLKLDKSGSGSSVEIDWQRK